MKKYLLISIPVVILLLIIVYPLTVFLLTNEGLAPHTREEVEAKLNNSLAIGFEYISTEIIHRPSLANGFKGENIYTFRDENGIEFQVISNYLFSTYYFLYGLLGSHYINYVVEKRSRCTYHTVLFLMYLEEFENTLAKYLNEGDFYLRVQEVSRRGSSVTYHHGYRIIVADFNDLPNAVDAIDAALSSMPPLPIKRDTYAGRNISGQFSGGFHSSFIPVIGLSYRYDMGRVLGWVDFYCVGDDEFDSQAFLKHIEYNFTRWYLNE